MQLSRLLLESYKTGTDATYFLINGLIQTVDFQTWKLGLILVQKKASYLRAKPRGNKIKASEIWIHKENFFQLFLVVFCYAKSTDKLGENIHNISMHHRRIANILNIIYKDFIIVGQRNKTQQEKKKQMKRQFTKNDLIMTL